MLWSNLLDLLRGGLFVLAHWCNGSLGGAILLMSVAVRGAMLPFTIQAQRRALRRAQLERELAPTLAALNDKHRSDPARLLAERNRVYASRGADPVDRRMLIDAVVQFPPAAAIYGAIRGIPSKAGSFLWIADLTRPDRLLAAGAAVLAAALAWVGVKTSGSSATAQTTVSVVVTGCVSFLVLSHISSAVALYSVANSIVGGVERVIAARTLDNLRT
jgi:membrane protein insertase Oxa1/YidC/SpoIIIJ